MFGKYLKMHRKAILLFVIYCSIAALVFGLYRLPVAAVGYVAVLCIFISAIVVLSLIHI